MTADAAFLAAIIAAPADDLPRLVYADYLDEHGDPDRAEFIRLQVDAARGDAAAEKRSEELLQANKARWEVPGIRGGQFFRRGFVEGVRMAAEEFVAHADRIGRSAPVTAVRLSLAAGFVREIARVAWLDRVEDLDLSGNLGVGRWLDELLVAAPLPSLRSLDLSNNNLLPDAVRIVADRAPGYPKLIRLNLSANFVSDEGMEVLAGSAALAGLTELVVRCEMVPFDSSVHAVGAAALAGSPHLTRLRVLDLAGQYVGDAGLADLVRSPNARGLEHLDVSFNQIGQLGDSGVEAVVESEHLGRLRVLDLSRHNVIGRIGAEALANWPRLEHMVAVDLTDCEIMEAARDALLGSPFHYKFILDEPTVTV